LKLEIEVYPWTEDYGLESLKLRLETKYGRLDTIMDF